MMPVDRRFHRPVRLTALVAALYAGIVPAAAAEDAATEQWGARFQATWIWQGKRPFDAAYSGPNSLSPDREKSYSFTATAALGVRPWPGGELYFDAEAAQGNPLSGLTGLGGFTNGEMARSSGATLKLYRARLFLRQTWGEEGAAEAVEPAANQLGGTVRSRRWVLTTGNLAVGDLFDANAYSHDARTQFQNWALVTHGAFDFAADARGYSWGFALERYYDGFAVRVGRFTEPREPNQQALDFALFRHFGDQIEMEAPFRIAGQPGKLRLLGFRSRARMARYEDALALAARSGGAPDLNLVRDSDRIKHGYGISVEQALSDSVGAFARFSHADGGSEVYAYTEIDQSVTAGLAIKGTGWDRADDVLGLAVARNQLSAPHRAYLAAGGLGFFIGDGGLRYRPEQILEAYYACRATSWLWLTAGWQRVNNPAYNADRGPVDVASLRMHAEF